MALATTVSRSRERLKKLPWVPPETLMVVSYNDVDDHNVDDDNDDDDDDSDDYSDDNDVDDDQA